MTKRKCLRVKLLVLLPQPLHVLRERRAARPAQLLDLDQAVKAAKDRPAFRWMVREADYPKTV